jgi:hypothetical protein
MLHGSGNQAAAGLPLQDDDPRSEFRHGEAAPILTQELHQMNASMFPRLTVMRAVVGLPIPASERAIPAEDDPETLARLAAIMADQVRRCPMCGRDLKICAAIGRDAEVSVTDRARVEVAAPALLPARFGGTG